MKKSKLLDILSMVKPGLSNNEVVEFSTSFIFHEGTLQTFNDEICVQVPLPKELAKIQGAFDAGSLFSLIKSVNEPVLKLAVKGEELQVTGKEFQSGIRRHTAETLPPVELPSKFKKIAEGLRKAIKTCLFSTSSDPARPLLNCVHIKPDAVESCDNFRITIYDLDTKVKKPILLNSRHAKSLLSYPITSYGTTDGWLHFKTDDGIIFSCRTFEQPFPDLTSVLQDNGLAIKLPEELSTTLDSAGVFMEADTRLDASLKMVFEKNNLRVESSTAKGWYKGNCAIRYTGNPVTVFVNPYMLGDILRMKGRLALGESVLIFKTKTFVHQVAIGITEEA